MPRSAAKPSPERRRAERAGRRGELWAAAFLMLFGYRIVDRRVKTPVGEIDLIARRGAATVFVEVKTRGRGADAAQALGAVNRRRIVRAAQFWLGRHPKLAAGDTRFDVILLAPLAWPRHTKNAFDTSGV